MRLIPSRAAVDAWCGCRTTLWQRIAGILSPLILIGTLAFIALRWNSLPEQIPTHYDLAGNINGYGSRRTLLIMPLMGLAADLVVAITARFPRSWNAGVRITVLNKARVYRVLRDLMAEIRLGCALMFAFLGVWISLQPERMSPWLLLSVTGLTLIVPIVRYAVRIRRAK